MIATAGDVVAYAVSRDDVVGFAEDVGIVAGALVLAAGLLWKIAKPAVERFVSEVRANQADALEQLTDERPDTLAGRAAELPRMMRRLERLEDQRLDHRVSLLETSDRVQDERLGNLESVLIRNLAGELRAERAENRATDPLARRDQARADRIRDRRRRETGETP